ncbi:MAG: electron transfer flavoprotein subunit beta/FixA family protein [Candidatus Njordarchaeia archaeon]
MSNIIVFFKYTYDPDEVRIDSKTRQPVFEGVNKKINEFDKNALEEAVRLKGILGGKIIAVTFSDDPEAKKGALDALSRGADEAYVIKDESAGYGDPNITAHVLSSFVKNMIGDFKIILGGSVSVDSSTGLVPHKTAKYLGIPSVSYVIKIIEISDEKAIVMRRIGPTVETIEVKLPAFIGVEMEINEPRIPKLSDILKAKKKPIHEVPINQFGLSKDQIEHIRKQVPISMVAPELKRKRIKIAEKPVDEMAKEFVETLKKEGIL